MIKPIKGTDETRQMIKGIVGNFQKGKPQTSHIDYSITLEDKFRYANLITDENKGQMRNISILRINTTKMFAGIRVAIGNKTGNLLLEEKPFYMSTKKALKKINDVLSQLQYNTEGQLTKKVDGSNSAASFEVNERYKTL